MADADASLPTDTNRRDLITTGLMMVAALASIAGFAALFSMWWRTDVTDNHDILRVASQEYLAGRPIVAGELAQRVEFPEDTEETNEPEVTEAIDPELDPQAAAQAEAEKKEQEKRAEWIRLRDFLVGVGKVARGRQEEDLRERRRFFEEALPYLRAARDKGFPSGHIAEGHRILGEVLFDLGRYDETIPSLIQAINVDPTMRRELLPILAEAQLNSLAPITDQALQTIDQYLAEPSLQDPQRWRAILTRIRALSKLKRWQEAQQAIQQAMAEPLRDDLDVQQLQADFRDELVLMQAVIRIRQTIDRYGPQPKDEYEDRSAATQALAGVVESLSRLQREASPSISARAKLWAARAYLTQGMIEDAVVLLQSVREQRPFGAEAIVAGLEEIELLASQGRGLEMLQTTKYMMRELGDRRGFDASMITFDEFQRRLGNAIDQLRRKGEYEHAIDVARSLPPVFDIADALIHEGIGFREWAAATIVDGTDLSGEVARSASVLARARFRAAGDAFSEAARLQFDSPDYLDTLWSAIDSYQEGRHFRRSIQLLESYLTYEERRRQPRGLIAYGRALLAEDEPDRAIDALTTCIVEFPRDPLRYDARLLAAQAYAEKGDLENARTLLRENLEDGELAPRNPTWRDSLFTLGELLYEHGYRNFLIAERTGGQQRIDLLKQNQPILVEAIRRLEESVARYWPIPRAETAQYLASRAHILSAAWPRIESKSPGILDAARRALGNQADQELRTALDGFIRLRQHLLSREEEQRLPQAAQALLRNCFIAEADVLRDMGLRDMSQLEDAAEAYRAVELRYMNEPLALEALLGRASCAKRLGRPREAALLIKQALVVLQRIPAEWDDQFVETTRYDRQGWLNYLTWVNQVNGNTS